MAFKRNGHVFCVLMTAFLLFGCAGPDRKAVLEGLRQDQGAGFLIEGVPFFPQNEYMCGPAALAGVMRYWGKDTGMEAVARKVYLEKIKGTLPLDLLIFARENGFDASYYGGGLDDLKKRLSEGTPLILFLNLGYDFYPVGHYVVAVGYNDRLKAVVANSNMNREEVFAYGRLLKAWAKTGYSTLLVRPKGR